MTDAYADLRRAFCDRQSVVGVIGLGYVGLPLAAAFCGAGFRVLGFDTDEEKLGILRGGGGYLRHRCARAIAGWTRAGLFEPVGDMSRLAEPDALLICVPTPLDDRRRPDLTCIRDTSAAIAAALRPRQLVVLESTTYPGTTRQVVRPVLDAPGMPYLLAYSPEREDPGNETWNLSNTPKVVGGIGEEATITAVCLYEQIVSRVVPVPSAEVAEACKILENTYRAVNIGLINELKVVFESVGVDVWEVVDAARTKPFGFQAFTPGPGLGGHCLPIDPLYLDHACGPVEFIRLADRINRSMPGRVVDRAMDAIRSPDPDPHVLVLGAAYKPGVGDVRESPSLDILDGLLQRGCRVGFHDPCVLVLPRLRSHPRLSGMHRLQLDEALRDADCVVLAVAHPEYAAAAERIAVADRPTVDCCGLLRGRPGVVQA